jgi:hypothetical protein
MSVNGIGTLASSGSLTIVKPTGATVIKAYLASASTGFTNFKIPNGDVTIDGTGVNWDIATPSSISSNNYWADVTTLVKSKIDAAAPGNITFTIGEGQDTLNIDGEILAVVFSDPNQTTNNTVTFLFGAQDVHGDTFSIHLAQTINMSDPNLLMDMSLGISFSHQDDSSPTGQYSVVNVNGQHLSTSRGGQDDCVEANLNNCGNGELLTVGGVGDSDANPPDPVATPGGPRTDDELYNIVPFLHTGDTSVSVFTQNPSNDDNIFFGAFFLKDVSAVVGQGIVLAPATASLPVGSPQLLVASVKDSLGNPIASRNVTFKIVSGPDAPHSSPVTVPTDANGNAAFTFTGSAAGPDSIVASFTDDQGKVITSDAASVTFSVSKKRSKPELKQSLHNAAVALKKLAIATGVLGTGCLLSGPIQLKFVCGVIMAGFGALEALKSGDFEELATKDPADPNFMVIDQPSTRSLSIQPISPVQGLSQRGADAFNALLTNLEQSNGLERAIMTSINRAQGASDAGNTYWENRQVQAAQQYAAQLSALLNAEPALYTNLQTALQDLGFQQTVTASDVSNFVSSVSRNGLPSGMAQTLAELGADTATLDEIRLGILTQDVNEVATLGSFPQALTDPSVTTALQQAAQALSQFAAGDTVPPTTTASLSPQPNAAGWNSSNVRVALNATDNTGGSGVAQTYYAVDTTSCVPSAISNCTSYSGSPFTVSGDGIHTLTFFSQDKAGNVEAANAATVKIDTTAPALRITGPANGTTFNVCGPIPSRPTFAPFDAVSGLDGTQGDSWTTPSTATRVGTYTYTAHAQDVAGNPSSETRTYQV